MNTASDPCCCSLIKTRKRETVENIGDMTGEENARTKENMLIIVIEKAILDPPFNSASVLLSGRLLVCAAKETFLCVPVSAGSEKTSGDEMFDHILGVLNGSEQTGRTQRCHFSGIKWDQVFSSHFPPTPLGLVFRLHLLRRHLASSLQPAALSRKLFENGFMS